MVRRVLFIVDAGPASGLGHLQRCLSLAEAMRLRGFMSLFAANPIPEVRARVEQAGFQLVPGPATDRQTSADCDLLIDVGRRHNCDRVVLDSYQIDSHYISAVRDAGFVTVVIDDRVIDASRSHIVVNGAPGAENLPYRSVAAETRFLLGANYALLGSRYWNDARRTRTDSVHRVLLSVGGADPRRVLPRLLQGVDMVRHPFSITTVLGPFASDHDVTASSYTHPVEFVRAPSQLRDLIDQSDLGISAGGQTLYELAATGTPAIAVQLFDNQSHNVRSLAAAGAVVDVDNVDGSDFSERLSSAITDIVRNDAVRERIGLAGPALIDGRGALRVAEAISELA